MIIVHNFQTLLSVNCDLWAFLPYGRNDTFLPIAAFRITWMIHCFTATPISPGVRGCHHIPLTTLCFLRVHTTCPTTSRVSKAT